MRREGVGDGGQEEGSEGERKGEVGKRPGGAGRGRGLIYLRPATGLHCWRIQWH